MDKVEPYFFFIQFDRLKETLNTASNIDIMQSAELQQRIEIAHFLVSLHEAISSDHWFDDGCDYSKHIINLFTLFRSQTEQQSVASLLANHKPEMFPRHIALEIQRVEREFQNHQVEVRLVSALQQGKEYLKSGNFNDISIRELEEVCYRLCIYNFTHLRWLIWPPVFGSEIFERVN